MSGTRLFLYVSQKYVQFHIGCGYNNSDSLIVAIIAGSLESANSSILAARRFFKEVVGKKIRILC